MTSNSIKRIVLGVDFHVWDGIFQGSRSHLIGLYTEAIRQASDIDFIFFLEGVESLRLAHPEFSLPHVKLIKMPHRPAFFRLAVQLPWMQLRHRLDILHMQYRLPFIRFGECACTIHDLLFETHPQYFPKSFIFQSKITYRVAAKYSALLFAVSKYSKNELTRLYGVLPERVAVTYNGVDRQHFRPGSDGADVVTALGLSPGRYVLTVGRLEPRKNHAALIKAFSRLEHDDLKLVIVGQQDLNYSGVLEALRDVGLADRVQILNNIPYDVLPIVMRHARVFAYPAFAEGFGMPVAEAMACGVPVVTSNTTSLPEVVGDAAILVDPDSVESIELGLRHLLEDEKLRSNLIDRGLCQVDSFDWGRSAAVLLQSIRGFLLKARS